MIDDKVARGAARARKHEEMDEELVAIFAAYDSSSQSSISPLSV